MSKLIKSCLIIGGGGHASVLVDSINKNNINIIGYVAKKKSNNILSDFDYLGDESIIYDFKPTEILLVNGIGSLPDYNNRWIVAKKFKNLNYKFLTVIHPSAIIANKVIISDGAQIMANVVLQTGVSIGEDSIINTSSSIDHDSKISRNCHIGPGSVLSGGVNIEENVHIGTGSTIIQNISIENNSIISAGSTIYKNLPKNTRFFNK